MFILSLFTVGVFASTNSKSDEDRFISYQVDLKKQELKLYWKDGNNQTLKSFNNLKIWVEAKNKSLVFAMNAGMYKKDNSPLGLFIQDGKTIIPLNKRTASGNFYLKPNGVFYVDNKNNAAICKTEKFINNGNTKYATKAGPMLVIDGNIHRGFKRGSANLKIRNGVGVLPNNNLIFAMSKKGINLYDFANYFKKLGCENALYFDGFVSRAYLPEKNWVQTDGNFGVMIGVVKNK